MMRKLFAASCLAGLVIAGASTGIRRTEPQRIRAVTVGFDDDLYDIDDILNQRPETSSYGLLTDHGFGPRAGGRRGLGRSGRVGRSPWRRWSSFRPCGRRFVGLVAEDIT